MYGAGVSRDMRYGQHEKARFKGSASHLEKPGVRILDYPMMGESSGASLWQMGDA